MRRLWPSIRSQRVTRTRALKLVQRPAFRPLSTSRSVFQPRNNIVTKPKADPSATFEQSHSSSMEGRPSSNDSPPSNGSRQFRDLVLSIYPPEGSSQLPQALWELHEAVLAALLPVNQRVAPVSKPLVEPDDGDSPFVRPFPGGQVVVAPFRQPEELEAIPTESVIALVSPIEGGRHYSLDAVRKVASTVGAEVIRLDLALGIGLNTAEAVLDPEIPTPPTLPKSVNSAVHAPLLPPPELTADPFDDVMLDEGEGEAEAPAIVVSPMMPQHMGLGGAGGPRHQPPLEGVKEQWVQYFERILNSGGVRDKTILCLEGVSGMAASFSTWWLSLVEATRRFRSGKAKSGCRKAERDLAIILSLDPSLLPAHTVTKGSTTSAVKGLEQSLPFPLRAILSQRMSGETKPSHEGAPWWGGVESDYDGREQRLARRLSQMASGNIKSLIPSLGPKPSRRSNLPLPTPLLDMIMANQGGKDGGNDEAPFFDQIIWRTIPVVPEKRDLRMETLERLEGRSALSAAVIHNILASYGSKIHDLDAALQEVGNGTVYPKADDRKRITRFSVATERRVAKAFTAPTIRNSHLLWQGNALSYSDAKQIALTAIGARLRTSPGSLDISWSEVSSASSAEKSQLESVKRRIDSIMPARTAPSPEITGSASPPRSTDHTSSLIASVRSANDLNSYERRLLPSIVEASKLSAGTFNHVHLPVHTIDTVRTLVTLPLLFPEAFRSGVLRDHSTAGALLFGPPGTGKTLLARAVANESGARMIAIQPSDVNDKYLGEGEKLVKAVFSLARRLAPCVIFIDEVDALFGARSGRGGANAGNRSHDQLLTEFMQEMDGLSSAEANLKKGIVVIGATNRPFDLDDAILRRLPRRLLVDLPDVKSRRAILDIMLRGEQLGEDVDLDQIAGETDGFSGSDLKHLCVSAALSAIKEVVKVPWRTQATSQAVAPTTPQESSDGRGHSLERPQQTLRVSEGSRSEGATHDIHAGDRIQTMVKIHPSPDRKPETVLSTGDVQVDLDANRPHNQSPEGSEPAQEDVTDPTKRRLIKRHFDQALGEIRPSTSEEGTLPELRKWADQFGEGGAERGRKKGFGKGFGFSDPNTKRHQEQGYGRVRQEGSP